MSTFIGQLIGFAVIVWIISKYVVPPVRKLMAEQKDAVRTQLEDSAKATARLAAADQYHAKRVDQGRAEGRHIVDEARTDSVRIAEQLHAQAGVEAERIKVQGGQQVSLLRAQLIRQLRGDLGGESVRRATELVKAYVADPLNQSGTVDRFLDELESMAPAAFAPEVAGSDLRSASRDAQAAVVARFDALSGSLSTADLSLLSDELVAVDGLLQREPILARHLADATGQADAKKQMLQRLLGGQVGATTLDILDTAASARWSKTSDFAGALAYVSRLSLLAKAEREGQADEVAEQLFRFGRILDSEPQLTTLLGDYSKPAADRVSLLRGVLDRASGTNQTAAALLTHTVELLHGERADEAVHELAELAVARRGEVVAQVSAAVELSDSQRRRLTEVLTRIYHNPVSVQLNVDPDLIGGLAVSVGDEVIDGTLSSRLDAAATKLPD
ncbi:MAG: F0F1 ATP synthase subunit B/delta [Mycobacterium sp.]|nr:F0F1 ATP synthase subunit B/delta [Mycobacterium sp.]